MARVVGKHTFFIQTVRHNDKDIQRCPQNAINTPTDIIIDKLALQASHGGEVYANAALDDAKGEKHEPLVAHVDNGSQAAANDHHDTQKYIRRGLRRALSAAQSPVDGGTSQHRAHEAGEDEPKGQLSSIPRGIACGL